MVDPPLVEPLLPLAPLVPLAPLLPLEPLLPPPMPPRRPRPAPELPDVPLVPLEPVPVAVLLHAPSEIVTRKRAAAAEANVMTEARITSSA